MKLALTAALAAAATAGCLILTAPGASTRPLCESPGCSGAPATTTSPALTTCMVLRPNLDPGCYKFPLTTTATKPPAATTTRPPVTATKSPAPQPKEGDSGNGVVSSCWNDRGDSNGVRLPRDFDQPRVTPIDKNGKRLGTLQVFYSRGSDGAGVNCAQVVLENRPLNEPVRAEVRMRLSGAKEEVWQAGRFREWAGGVYVQGTAGKCIDVTGSIGEGKDQVKAELKDAYCGR